MPYITEQDLIELFGNESYFESDGSSSSTVRIASAISVVEEEVDAYLRSAGYAIPFTGTGIKGRIADWVRYRLADDQGTVTDNIKDRYNDAVEFFEKVGEGDITLQQPSRNQIGFASVTRA